MLSRFILSITIGCIEEGTKRIPRQKNIVLYNSQSISFCVIPVIYF